MPPKKVSLRGPAENRGWRRRKPRFQGWWNLTHSPPQSRKHAAEPAEGEAPVENAGHAGAGRKAKKAKHDDGADSAGELHAERAAGLSAEEGEQDVLELRNRDVVQDSDGSQSAAPAAKRGRKKKKALEAVPEAEEVHEVHEEHEAAETAEHAPEIADPRVLELVSDLDAGRSALRGQTPAVDDEQLMQDVEHAVAGAGVDFGSPADESYAEGGEEYGQQEISLEWTSPQPGFSSYSEEPFKRKRGRPPGPRREALVLPTRKLKIDDKIYIIAQDHWDRVLDFFATLEMEGIAQVSTLNKDFRNDVEGEIGGKRGADVSDFAADGTAVQRTRGPKDRDYWTQERVEALRQGVILFCPFRDKDSLTISYFYRTGIFGDRKGPHLKDKRRNILSKILRDQRYNVTVDTMVPWIFSLVNPAERPIWEAFEAANPGWKDEAAERMNALREEMMAELGVSEEDLIGPGHKATKDSWWHDWEIRRTEAAYNAEGQGGEVEFEVAAEGAETVEAPAEEAPAEEAPAEEGADVAAEA
ncbi:hypothetical protein DFJ74DRAFT_765041 [Hyaloraphidium curvatum]|nr:hypothetical protein DFJ74DRAFT_765041 [Hyaloraphidium curvatum]